MFGLASSTETLEREWREMRHSALLEGFPEYVKYEGQAAEIRLFEIGIILDCYKPRSTPARWRKAMCGVGPSHPNKPMNGLRS